MAPALAARAVSWLKSVRAIKIRVKTDFIIGFRVFYKSTDSSPTSGRDSFVFAFLFNEEMFKAEVVNKMNILSKSFAPGIFFCCVGFISNFTE